jgi:TonB family protein
VAEKKGLAVASLALGIVGLFSGGGLIVGSLLGLGLAAAALSSGSRAGRDVAWAGLTANVFALLTVFPVAAAVLAYRSSPVPLFDESLPEPAQNRALVELPDPPPPPPPPPPSPRPRSAEARSPAEAAPPSRPVRVGAAIPEPRKVRNVSPVYPPDAVRARVQGAVVLECTISPAGTVVAVRPLQGPPLLRDAAIAAVEQWEYEPTLLNGVAVPVIVTVTVNFTLR